MMIKRKAYLLILYLTLSPNLLLACGSRELPISATLPSLSQDFGQVTQLTQKLESLQKRLDALEQKSPQAKPAIGTSDSKKLSDAPHQPQPTAQQPGSQPASKATSTDTAKALADNASKAPGTDKFAQGRQLLDKVMANISGVAGFDTLVNKYEIGLQSGEESDAQIRMIGKAPHQIKIEVTRHATKKGLKVAYTGGTDKVDIRPNGILSLINTSKKMNDPLLVSKNGHEPDDMDFYSLAKRFANPAYKAELAGQTTVNGQSIHILKITSPANTLNPAISHEYIGFDPQNHAFKLWEAYSDKYQSGQKAFIRSVVESFKPLSNVPEQMLKV